MTTHLHVTLVTETFAPEINGVANTLGRLYEGLRARGHRVELIRPRQAGDQGQVSDDQLLLCRGWPLPGYPGLQWGQASMHKLLRRWKRHRPDVLYIATEGPLGLSALRGEAPGHFSGQRLPHQLPAIHPTVRARIVEPGADPLFALVS